jgi:hypothetical protein
MCIYETEEKVPQLFLQVILYFNTELLTSSAIFSTIFVAGTPSILDWITGQLRTSKQNLTFNFNQENIRYII